MKLTTKGRYAVTALLDVALHQNDGPVTLSAIAERQNLSVSYLEQLFAKLRRSELVHSFKGPGGGYSLAVPSDDLVVSKILDAVDETIDAMRCQGHGGCQSGQMCLTHHLWQDLSDQIHQFLSRISLGELMQRHDLKKTLSQMKAKPMANSKKDSFMTETIETKPLPSFRPIDLIVLDPSWGGS
jgi:Rrf2 family iron-sulfur cluster assembly transcriptional regulator